MTLHFAYRVLPFTKPPVSRPHNSRVCTAPSTSPSQAALRFVHNSFSGFNLFSASRSSKVPTKTARSPLNCSAASLPSAVLQIGLLQLSQKKVLSVIPFSCFSVYRFGSPANNSNWSFLRNTHVEFVLPVVLWQALQWQRTCYVSDLSRVSRASAIQNLSGFPYLRNRLAGVLVLDGFATTTACWHFR